MTETQHKTDAERSTSDGWQEEHRSLSGLMTVVQRQLNGEFHRRMDEAGYADIRPGAGNVFEHISPEGSTIASMALRAGVSSQAMVQTVDYLERRGYVRRVPDPTDRRAKLIQVTERGHSMRSTAARILEEMETQVRNVIGDTHLQNLRASMQQIVAIMSQHDGEKKVDP